MVSVFLLLSLLTTVRFTCRAAICTQSVRDIALRAVAKDLSLFGAFLFEDEFRPQKLTKTYSRGTYIRNLLIRSHNTSRSGGEPWSAELSSHTSSFCFNHNKL